jgi:CHAT domain-containing protein
VAHEKPQRLLAVLADPVFEADDPRLSQKKLEQNNAAQDVQAMLLTSAVKSITRAGDLPLARLPFTMQEAQAIVGSAPGNTGTMITGFAANRDLVIKGGLQPYRIVHFATHGVVNCEHPELSGIVLSMLNEQGERENGFLQLHDIYDLELSADLVVLSACRTGLGQDIRGEGLVGLTQGFFHRGANTVISTLWTIDDRASAELMKYFYEAMLQEGATSAAALRSAKQKLWNQKRWQSPYYWAAFVVQGDYRQTITVPSAPSHWPVKITAVIVLLLACGAFAVRRALFKPANSRKSSSTGSI